MEKRTLLAFILIALVLMLSPLFLPTPPRKPAPQAPTPETPAGPPPSPQPASGGPAGLQGGQGLSGPLATLWPPALQEPRSVEVESDLYRYVFTTQGGLLARAYLKTFPSFQDSGAVQLVPDGATDFLRGILATDGDSLDTGLLPFTPSATRLRLDADHPQETLRLVYEGSGGDRLAKELTFFHDRYVIEARFRWERGQAPPPSYRLLLTLGPRLRSTEKDTLADYSSLTAVLKGQGGLSFKRLRDVRRGPVDVDPADWVSLKTKYFLAAMVAVGNPFRARVESPETAGPYMRATAVMTVPASQGELRALIYVGPQEPGRLKAVGRGLEDIAELGWSFLRPIIKPFSLLILEVLVFLHRFIPNYGVVLILFAVLMRLALWPLSQKTFQAMRKMQLVQPQLLELKQRYEKDPIKLREETFKLYKQEKANPLGGCLPNLIPMPVLFALFFVFQNTIELRGAAFVGWLNDLSRPDPYWVMPILMGVTMYIQQKLTPGPKDPRFAPMMYLMPVFLTFLFGTLASGLVLYYTVYNLLTFAQQYWYYKKYPLPVAPAPKKKS